MSTSRPARCEWGRPALLDVDVIEGIRVVWAGPPVGSDPVGVLAQVRAHGIPVAARARMAGDRLVVDLEEPIRGLAAGQAVVLYEGTRVVGSATVDATRHVMAAGTSDAPACDLAGSGR